MPSTDLEVKVARAIKAALDAEGLDFSAPLRDNPPDVQAMQRASARFQRDNPDLMEQVREWYLANHPPLHEEAFKGGFLQADEFYLVAFSVERGYWWQHVGEEATGEPPG